MRRCQDSSLWSLPHPGHHQLLSPMQPLNPPTSFNSAVTASVRAAVIPHLDQAGRSPLTSLSPHLLPCSDSRPSVRVAFNLLLQADIVWAPSPSLTAYSQTGLFSVSRTSQPLLPQHCPCPQAFARAVLSAQNVLPWLIPLAASLSSRPQVQCHFPRALLRPLHFMFTLDPQSHQLYLLLSS